MFRAGAGAAGYVCRPEQASDAAIFWPSAPALQIETWLVMLIVLGIGVLVGAGLFWFRVLALKAQIWRLNKEKQSREEDAAAKLSQDRPPQNTPRLIS